MEYTVHLVSKRILPKVITMWNVQKFTKADMRFQQSEMVRLVSLSYTLWYLISF